MWRILVRQTDTASRGTLMTSMRIGWPVLLLCALLLSAAACRHDCAVAGRPKVGFAVASCCGSQSRYYWDDRAKDCVELPPVGMTLNCGCVCEGECSRLYWSLEQCRRKYAHCR